MHMQDHMTVYQAAEALGISVDTIRRRIKAGKLAATQDEKGQWWLPMHVIQPLMQMPMQESRDAYALPMQAIESELEDLRQELAIALNELESARRETASAKAEISRLEVNLTDLRQHNADLREQLQARTNELQQEQANHEAQLQRRDSLLLDLQQRLSLPAPEPKLSFFQRLFGRK